MGSFRAFLTVEHRAQAPNLPTFGGLEMYFPGNAPALPPPTVNANSQHLTSNVVPAVQ